VPTYYAAIRLNLLNPNLWPLTFWTQNWHTSNSEPGLRSHQCFCYAFLCSRWDKWTDRQTEGRARAVMWPIRTATYGTVDGTVETNRHFSISAHLETLTFDLLNSKHNKFIFVPWCTTDKHLAEIHWRIRRISWKTWHRNTI